MCPATNKYLTAYIDKNNCPIRIDDRVAADVEKNARSVLAMAKRGAKVIFPDVFKIYHELEQHIILTSRSPDTFHTPDNLLPSKALPLSDKKPAPSAVR